MGNQKKGFFTIKDSACYAGVLFIKLCSARRFILLKDIKYALSSAAKAIKVILREIKLHYFSPKKLASNLTPLSVNFLDKVSKYKKNLNYAEYYLPQIHFFCFMSAKLNIKLERI